MSSARKPVIVRKLTQDWCAGYVNAEFSVEGSEVAIHELELLDTSGKLVDLAWSSVKWVCFVRELDPGSSPERENPERLLRRRFASKPRSPGLWLRLTLSDGEEIEGVAANDRSLIEGAGVLLTPPDTRSNTQRVFVPRSAIRELVILSVIPPAKPAPIFSQIDPFGASRQPKLFDPDLLDAGQSDSLASDPEADSFGLSITISP